MLAFRNYLPKFFSIEVTSPEAYSLGIKDNDIILGWNGEQFDSKLPDSIFKNNGHLKEVTDAAIEKELTLYRIDPTTLQPR